MNNALIAKLKLIYGIAENSSRIIFPKLGVLNIGILMALFLIFSFVAFIIIRTLKNGRRR